MNHFYWIFYNTQKISVNHRLSKKTVQLENIDDVTLLFSIKFIASKDYFLHSAKKKKQ